MHSLRSFRKAPVLIGFLFFISGLSQGSKPPPPVKVAALLSLSRDDGMTPSPWGAHVKNALELSLNSQLSKSIDLKIYDISGSALKARALVEEALQEGADLITGLSNSDQALMVQGATEKARVGFISVEATAEALFSDRCLTFSLGFNNRNQAARILHFVEADYPEALAEGVGLVVSRNCSYCVDLEKELTRALEEKKIKHHHYQDVLNSRPIPKDFFNGQSLKKIIIVLTYETEAVTLIDQLIKANFKGVIAGGDSWSMRSEQMRSLPVIPETLCLASALTYDRGSLSKVNKDFIRLYQQTYGVMPTDAAALGFDTGLVIAKTAAACRFSPSKNRSRCITTKIKDLRVEGTSGPIAFGALGQRTGSPFLLKSAGCR